MYMTFMYLKPKIIESLRFETLKTSLYNIEIIRFGFKHCGAENTIKEKDLLSRVTREFSECQDNVLSGPAQGTD